MKKLNYALLFVGGAALILAIIQLFQIRFARGDVYPSYSTLRTDPLGAKVFYESLAHLDDLNVSRNQKSLLRIRPPRKSTLFFIGMTHLGAPEKEIARLEQFVKDGGRLVVAFYPQSKDTALPSRDEKKIPSPSPSPSASAEEPPPVKFLSTTEVAKRWELTLQADAKLVERSAEHLDPAGKDPKLSWHSVLHFKDSAPIWKNIYTAAGFPVVIERPMGQGTIVIASDSYFLSNEAMRRERHAQFLAWLVGPNREVIFEETHLGISEDPGVSALVRRYHLGGLLAGLFVLAVLAVWKNSARLLPAAEARSENDEVIIGKESFAGFVNLLRRNIAPSEVLSICVEEWSKFLPRKIDPLKGACAVVNEPKEQIDCAKKIVQDSPHDLVGAYQQISHALHETKWKPHNLELSKH